MKIATGWDEDSQQFTGHRDCNCPGYDGPLPSEQIVADCPHEIQPEGPHPDTCVHCGARVAKPVK